MKSCSCKTKRSKKSIELSNRRKKIFCETPNHSADKQTFETKFSRQSEEGPKNIDNAEVVKTGVVFMFLTWFEKKNRIFW